MWALALLIFSVGFSAWADDPSTGSPPSLELLVQAKKIKLENSAPVSQSTITQDQIRQQPRGDQVSLPQLLEATTPSVVSGGYGRIFTRQDENGLQYQLDGIELPDLPDNAIGDFFNARNIERMEVTLGALPAEYGDRPSGVINMITPRGSDLTEGSVEVNYGSYNSWSPQAQLRGSTSDGFIRYFFSANYHRTDRGLDTPQPISLVQETKGTSDASHDKSHGNNEFAKVDFNLSNSDDLSVLLSNREEFYQIPNFPASYSPTNPLFGQGDAYGNDPLNYTPPGTNDSQSELTLFTELVWKHSFSEKEFLQLGVFYKYFNIRVDNDPANDLAAILDPTLTNNPSPSNTSLYEARHTHSEGAKLDYQIHTGDRNQIKAGMKSEFYQTAGTAVVTGANPFGGGPRVLSATDSAPITGSVEGLYIQDEWKITDRLFLNSGLRFDYLQANYSDAQPSFHQFEPRLLLSYMVTESTKIHLYYGRLFNVPLFEDLHDTFSALANQGGQSIRPYDIKPEKDNYYETGLEQELGGTHKAALTFYYKQATDLLDDAQLLNTALQQPFNWANGYAYGLEFSAHGRFARHWSDYFNYSYGIAKGSGISGGLFAVNDPPSGGYQLLDHVQKHTANAGLTYDDAGFSGSLIAKYGSGLPTGPSNNFNAPGHYSWDTSLSDNLLEGRNKKRLMLTLDVLNIFNNRYAIFIANGFNGSYFAAGREFLVHLSLDI